MSAETLAMSSIAAIGDRPWLSNAFFGFTKWGNPFAEERFSSPYPMYERMRAEGPVVYSRLFRQWFVFGYDEVNEDGSGGIENRRRSPVGRGLHRCVSRRFATAGSILFIQH